MDIGTINERVDFFNSWDANLSGSPKENVEIDVINQIEDTKERNIAERYFSQLERDKNFRQGNLLPPPDLSYFASQNAVYCFQTNDALKNETSQPIGNYLQDFANRTGVKAEDHGRTIVNMSGEEALCGFRAVLSQIDPSCSGAVLSHPHQGGTVSMDDKTLEKIYSMRLAIAIDEVNADNGTGGQTLEEIKEKVVKSINNPELRIFNTEPAAHTARLFSRKVVIIDDGNGDFWINEKGERITFPLLCVFDKNNIIGTGLEENEDKATIKRTVENILQDPKAIVLYRVNGNHFMSVQNVDPNLQQNNAPGTQNP